MAADPTPDRIAAIRFAADTTAGRQAIRTPAGPSRLVPG